VDSRECFPCWMSHNNIDTVHYRLLACPLFSVDTTLISDSTMRSVADRFLGVGETIFDIATATSVNSEYFKKDSRR
jgi:hypothetical protein